MNKIAKFYKVSFQQFLKDYNTTFDYGQNIIEIQSIWDSIKLPTRATSGSAGYDFATPIDFIIKAGATIKIPTGIRCKMDEGWVLNMYPRSSIGFKYRVQLDNTVGIIDGDYFNSDNEGHIWIKVTNNSNNKIFMANSVDNIVQGVFVPYGITVDDNVNEIRNGGFGSTGK
ncbi:MAG: hypothetical protein NC417_07155 [Candidatus Gastranaerophilales bacterium]|nr:hypothetical protein [Candidatus Gastranaerophilales bacterium]